MRKNFTRGRTFVAFCLLAAISSETAAGIKPAFPRVVVDLNGTWQIEQGTMETRPIEFRHVIPVPGLVDLARPGFSEVGQKSDQRQAFWYRRTFRIEGPVPEIARLKVHKAKYGMQVWVNGQVVGQHSPCFTPAYFDVQNVLRGAGQENELLIRVGADRESLPQDMPTGWDFEKYRYIPGIYDSVELILSGRPFLHNIQIAPDLENSRIRVVAEIERGMTTDDITLSGELRTARESQLVQNVKVVVPGGSEAVSQVDFLVEVPDCQTWSPESPFLYELHLSTAADAARTRFGMRTFRFDPKTKRALLNGKPYYLRGSNLTLYRFFEDAERSDLPWRTDWVRQLHRQCKSMHWNSLRYCIGFPPEFWYDLADEEGVLIQDEFPIWLLSGPKSDCPEWPVAEKIIPEYEAWMRERWNHPCVVIWDAQNESQTPETGKAIQAVRHLDRSDRPWDNGWAEPQAMTDCAKAHPYLFIREFTKQKAFHLSELASQSGKPNLQDAQRKMDVALLINEYAWLWLTRDGNPTCLTSMIYERILGSDSTAEQRRIFYARSLAALTEFWRSHRECAGVLHFCALGYSRPGDKPRPEGGATSDHWANVLELQWEPRFQEYVRDAFNPLGLMLNFWSEEVSAGAQPSLEVCLVNDLEEPWQGEVHVYLELDQQKRNLAHRDARVSALGRSSVSVPVTMPHEPGHYTLVAELTDGAGETIRSLRDITVK